MLSIIYSILAASAARGASPQKHVYVRYMSIFSIDNILRRQALFVLDDGRRHKTRPPASFDSKIYIHTAHQQTTTCFKIDFFRTFFEFFSRNFKMTLVSTRVMYPLNLDARANDPRVSLAAVGSGSSTLYLVLCGESVQYLIVALSARHGVYNTVHT
jgi:hypothetical protein